MKTFKEYLEQEKTSNKVVVKFHNSPTKLAPKCLFESLNLIEEGKTKDWGERIFIQVRSQTCEYGGRPNPYLQEKSGLGIP